MIVMKQNEDRFIKTYEQGSFNVFEIWVDRMTGVNYLYRNSGTSGGLTVLLDKNGKPIVTSVFEDSIKPL